MILTQFRIRYPQGSVISELITIDHGQYIVKVSVQVGTIILGTGLAGANTIEEAEDYARNRALALVDLDNVPIQSSEDPINPLNKVVTHQKSQETEQELKTTTEKKVSLHNSITPEIEPFLAQTLPIQEHSLQTTPKTPLTSSKKDQENIPQGIQDFIPEPSPVGDTPVSIPDSPPIENTPVPIPDSPAIEDTPVPIPDSLPIENTPVSIPDSLPIENTPVSIPDSPPIENTPVPIPDSPPIENTPVSIPEVVEESADVPEKLDFSEVIARSDVEMKRLGWTKIQGRDYLVQTYGKRSRQVLSDEELLEFVSYLENQPSPS